MSRPPRCRLVDPSRGRQRRGDRYAVREAFGMHRIGGPQELGALLPLGGGQPVVDVVRSHQPEGAVAMLEVVPGEEPLAERLGVLVGAEPIREIGPVLERLKGATPELTFTGGFPADLPGYAGAASGCLSPF